MAKRTNRIAWGLAAVLAMALLGAIALLGVRLRPYWVAKYRGDGAELDHQMLIRAPLAGADLMAASLRGVDLHSADLQGALLAGADLSGADLTGADLRNVMMGEVAIGDILSGPVRISGTKLTGVRYDAHTHWPDGFNPAQHGAILVE
jgi:hypothetical protein